MHSPKRTVDALALDDDRNWFDYKLATEYTTMSAVTLRRAVVKGELECHKIGHAVRFRREDLDSWMARHAARRGAR